MKYGSICSGIEAASVAWEPLGFTPVFFSEIEKFPSQVLKHHWPHVPNLGDFTTINGADWDIDVLVGGTPCQAFSLAGLRNSLNDDRGNLTLKFVELIHATKSLRYAVWENVVGVLSTSDNAFGCFLGGLVGADEALCTPDGQRWPDLGMVAGPLGRAAWRVLDAQWFGLAQRRRRVFLVFCPATSRGDPAAVLFERQGVRGNTPPSRETRENVAGTLSARTSGGGGLGTDFELGGGLQVAKPKWPAEVASTLDAHFGDKMGLEDQHVNAGCPLFVPAVAHTLKAEGFDASEDGTGRQTLVSAVAFSSKDYGGDATYELSPTLRASGHKDSHANAGAPPAIAFDYQGSGKQTTLGASEHHTGTLGTTKVPAIAFALRGREGGAMPEIEGDITGALRAASGGSSRSYVAQAAVRRLTPVECERLQGFPDNFTDISPKTPDGPRYRALGNSMATNVMSWIGKRILLDAARP